LSIEVKQLIIKTTIKDDDVDHAQAMSEDQLNEKISEIKKDLNHHLTRIVEQQLKKQWEP